MSLAHPTHHRTLAGECWVRRALLAVSGFSAVNAIAGGLGLILTGLGVPQEQLASTPFDSFTVPGLLLAGVVGGTMATATAAVWQRVPWAGEVAMVAGAIMLGWIAIESVMIADGRSLQVTVAGLAVATLLLGWRLRQLNQAAV